MNATQRGGAAGRQGTDAEDQVREMTRKLIETTMPKAWHDLVLRRYGALLVIANIPPGKPIWFPPAVNGDLPGVLLARAPKDAVRFLAALDPLSPAPADGAQVAP